ncbi:MAG: DNA-binding protein WhiA [Oscillospiraceae bacterium]|jgi:DNA-binding protein WhiA|nr:DNA-binding protein WhiA [Oscillospiraceae bacterium]
MSFSSETKEELCRFPLDKRCCAVAEAYGALLYGNLFSAEELRLVTGSAPFAARLPELFRRAFALGFDPQPAAVHKGRETFSITKPKDIRRVFEAYGYEPEALLAHHINLGVLEERCCKISFLRGAFLAGGSLSDPGKSYHLELVTPHYSVSRETLSMLLELGFAPKDLRRSGNYITYFKQSGAIEDFLTTIGAPVAAMKIMSAKVEKDMRNTINRRVNCDSANADKIVSASQEQLDAIEKLALAGKLDALPEKLREAAQLRLGNPESSLSELAAMANPPVSKSCMSHRMRQITDKR